MREAGISTFVTWVDNRSALAAGTLGKGPQRAPPPPESDHVGEGDRSMLPLLLRPSTPGTDGVRAMRPRQSTTPSTPERQLASAAGVRVVILAPAAEHGNGTGALW